MRDQPDMRGGRQGGFTMIEVLVTLAVTLVGLGGLLTLHHVIARGAHAAGRMAEASGIAEAAVEELRQIPFAKMETMFGTPPIDTGLDPAAGKGERTYDLRLIVEPLAEVSADLFRVRVEVRWTDDGAEPGSERGTHDHRLVVETLRTRQEAL